MHEPAFWHRPSSLTSRLLTPFAALYGAIAARRMARPGANAGVPVICVGNYHTGGAGKTPTVLALVTMLHELGEMPFVLSRGYGGSVVGPIRVDVARHAAAEVGDEPLMMAAHAPVVIARDRVAGATLARGEGASVIVMDDGFQNPALRKDFSLIVVGGGRGLGNGSVFPAGPLRAPLAPQLVRTDALLVIGEGDAAADVEHTLAARGVPVFHAHVTPDAEVVATLRGQRVLAFAGIGDPGRFFDTLRAHGIEVAAERTFPDHHRFTKDEVWALRAEAARDGLALVTTEKDFARLSGGDLASLAEGITPLPVTLRFDDGARLRELIASRLRNVGRLS
ncbi:MAG: tetraacyldisaccharide 4'-kinase [Rhizobiales bacterium]|nr:tetraacyldisaccharide 4'-kinase [Hyphomicrobiales bacterium]